MESRNFRVHVTNSEFMGSNVSKSSAQMLCCANFFHLSRRRNDLSFTLSASSTIKRRNSSIVLGSSTISLSPRPRSGTSINHELSLCHQRRPMTPPVEELSSSLSDGCVAKRTISSLRKILDEQPQAIPLPRKSHVFMPVTPPPRPVLGTSSATASISRMLTKKLHHASTRPPSPPRSAMKGSMIE